MLRALVLVPLAWAVAQGTHERAAISVHVEVRGGTCRPQPTVFWLTGDGREVGATPVPADGASMDARVIGAAAPPSFLLAECRGYYAAGVPAPGAASVHVALDRAIPPRQRRHRDGVHVLVQDGERGTPVAGALVMWVRAAQPGRAASVSGRTATGAVPADRGGTGRAVSDGVATDRSGRAVLPLPVPGADPDGGQGTPTLVLVRPADPRLQVTAQRYRAGLDDYTLIVRGPSPR